MLPSRERNTVLAALRFWQAQGGTLVCGDDKASIATNCFKAGPLSDEEIDRLCESLNASSD